MSGRGLLITLLGTLSMVYGQFQLNSLMSYQLGNLPYVEPRDYQTLYQQVDMAYRYSNFRASTKIEYFLTPESSRQYANFSQYRIEYTGRKFYAKAGHFYDIFGRGLLLRAWDLSQNIFEDQGQRVRQGFYKDIFGGVAGYKSQSFNIKFLKGQPLINQFSATKGDDVRRLDDLSAVETNVSFSGYKIGAGFVHNDGKSKKENILSTMIGGQLSNYFDIYLEYTHSLDEGNEYFSLASDNRFGLYGNLNYYSGDLGVTLEYKYYNLFLLGSGYNDPPSLIRENPYPVINRSVHVTQLQNEQGLQIEALYNLSADNILTINLSHARNEFDKSYQYSSIFMEWEKYIADNNRLILFAEISGDEFQNEINRYAGGAVYESDIWENWRIKLDLEGQRFDRPNIQDDIYNGYFSVTLGPSSNFNGSVIAEISNDHFLTDNPNTIDVEMGIRTWFGLALVYQPTYENRFELFAGQRRGGPSCTSGICYEVLDFEGIELNWKFKI